MREKLAFILIVSLCTGCAEDEKLMLVSVEDYEAFVVATDYVTDAERYGWSVIQEDVYSFRVDSSLTWRIPNGIDSSQHGFPVTQVSYNDALAYCTWTKTRLPSYEEYWTLAENDKRHINQDSDRIYRLSQSNIVGNTWEITRTEDRKGFIRLAGGSYLCNANTCNGTQPSRELFVDKETGNTHIGFSVIR